MIVVTYDPAAVIEGGYEYESRINEDLRRLNQKLLAAPGDKLPRGAAIGFDTEYDPKGALLTVGVASLKHAAAIETAKGWKKKVAPIIKGATTLIGHSVGGDLDYLVAEGMAKNTWLAGKNIRDSLLLARMADENRGKGGYSLEPLLLAHFNFDPWKAETEKLLKKSGNAADWSEDQRVQRCRIDAWASATLARHYEGEVPAPLAQFTHAIALSLHRVGLAGAAIDRATFHRLGHEWQAEAAKLKKQLVTYAHKNGVGEFSPTNDDHLRTLLFKKLKLPVLEKTEKSGAPKVDKATLKKLLAEHNAPKIVATLLEFNAVDKLASTWYGAEGAKNRKKSVAELIEAIPGNKKLGLLHFWIFPLRARTGRRASGGSEEGSPESRNSQNWSPKARGSIVSRWLNGKIAVADFAKLEVVLMGWRANDGKLLDYFLNGKGYIGVAEEFWGQTVEPDTLLYKATKSLVLGLDYNMGWWKLALDLWNKAGFRFSDDWDTHCAETKKARKRYLAMFPGLRNYIRNRIAEVTETQQVVSPTGRIRHLPHHGEDSEGFWHVKNAAVNFPIQSFASDVTGSAIVDYEAALLKEHKLSYSDWHYALLKHPHDLPASPVFNEVHDELDLDLHPKSGKRDLEILVDAMENVRTLKTLVPKFNIKLRVDVQTVSNWGAAK